MRADDREFWEDLFDVMKDQERCPIEEVPVTGLSSEYEYLMSSMFIEDIAVRVRCYITRNSPDENSNTMCQCKHSFAAASLRRACRESPMALSLRQCY